MAFDSPTRNKLQRMVGACRRLLADEFDDQLQGLYGIYAQDGRVLELEKLTSLDDDHHQTATLLRDRINHLTSGMASEKQPLAEAVRRVLREQAFTLLNRFAALRMAEERGFVQECVGQGLKSKGFQVFETVARSGLGGAYERYVTFVHGMFDELSLDLGVLFDRWSPFGLLFPREPALLKFFELLNDPELKPLWKEDETIGWIYQYFNDEAERKKMREESSAPRNSRELAVRNQFFTPRYVVEFLTDNTLGRIWYEMCRGQTRLKDQCRYLVRRPVEVFLAPGETAPAQKDELGVMSYEKGTAAADAAKSALHPSSLIPHNSKAPTQEELLRQPVHIPHRPLKDPRTILMLDPACGSMHFGLYAFDLFEVIYDEAWELEKRGVEFQPRPLGMLSLQETYGTKDDFLKDVPRLIIEHNLHGIDIDPRCAQIAGLSLWLRAQKAWQRLGLKPAERPAIKRSNIVCAEPMPGEKELLREFVEREFPTEERGVVLRLLETIFDKMQLAGEAGSLLKIEEEISSAIEDARRQWQAARQRPEFFDADQLATLDKRAGAQQELPAAQPALLPADLRSLTSEVFWERIEERIYAALRDYAEQAENGGGFQRRLFAEDAARGFAFIDVCRKRYDVALMNPPFGETSALGKPYLFERYPISKFDLAAAFADRAEKLMTGGGVVGSLTNRSIFYGQMLEDWRRHQFLANGSLLTFGDLGVGVLDAALVEAVAYTFSLSQSDQPAFFFKAVDRIRDILEFVKPLVEGRLETDAYLIPVKTFQAIPDFPFAYWTPSKWLNTYNQFRPLESFGFVVRQGMESSDNFRFVRLWWETPSGTTKWKPYSKGGWFGPHWRDMDVVVNWGTDGREVKEFSGSIYGTWTKQITNSDYYGVAGLCYPASRVEFSPRILPRDCIVGCKGPIVALETAQPNTQRTYLALLAVMSSSAFRALVNLTTTSGDTMRKSYRERAVACVPIPDLDQIPPEVLDSVSSVIDLIRVFESSDETCRFFATAVSSKGRARIADEIRKGRKELDDKMCSLYGFKGPSYVAFEQTGYDDLQEGVVSNPDEMQSYMLGLAFGRWDIRYATGEQAAPELPDPFAPLPVCPPGQLQSAQGLPARPEDVPAAYPVRIPWDGILVDDPNHPLDIERRVREVIEIVWGAKENPTPHPGPLPGRGGEGGATAEAIEHEACEILGVKSLRDYFRKPAGFFADHLKRYSKSRRQAPIYWPLSTASGSYTLWIYYHRLTDQTLFQCVNDFVKPKLEEVNRDIERLRGELQRADGGNSKQREKLQELEDFTNELKEFHDELLRVAGLPYKPNLNDGVILTASPLWKLFRLPKWQKDLKACWEALEGEEYEWAHLAYTIWPDRVKAVCKKDRSIAIAHGLEALCEVKAPEKKAKRGKKAAESEQVLDV